MRGLGLLLAIVAIALFPRRALADADAAAPASVHGCVETVLPGATRPFLTETFPDRGFSGYASTLVVTVEHGKGERVLPNGLELQQASDATKALTDEGWVLPDQDGGAAARVSTKLVGVGDRAKTTFELPLLALPKEPGRHRLTLPALPIAVSRANGELSVMCTHVHTITIDDPTASTDNPTPKPNPPPVAQREEWTALKNLLAVLSIGLLLGAIVTTLVRRWMRRPKPVPPPPPPRPPWDVALERLDEVRHAGLLDTERFGEYFDRVNDALRSYLGARYGFDGLESTTDEILWRMKAVPVAGVALPEIAEFLQTCDLVKFANMTPTAVECTTVLDAGEKIVRKTIPAARPPATTLDAAETEADS